MYKPFISPKVSSRVKDGNYRVFAESQITVGEEIEVCSFIPMSRRAIAALEKNVCFDLTGRFFVNPEEAQKESLALHKLKNALIDAESSNITGQRLLELLNAQVNENSIENFKIGSILLGFGSIYSKSDEPNCICTYLPDEKLYLIKAVKNIVRGEELVLPRL